MDGKKERPPVHRTSDAAIIHGFDVGFVSQLSHHERSSFKPVYSMTKWWARRSSSSFRAILLALGLDPAGDLQSEFYKNQQHNPEFDSGTILDPFMGGGTTVVEALRLGHTAVGVDLNPVAWFSVKTETTKVDLDELRDAFRRIERAVAEDIFHYYTTTCPCCGDDARAMHTFWVKIAPCSHRDCSEAVPLFRDFVVGQRRNDAPVEYFEVECPSCASEIDCETTPLNLVPDAEAENPEESYVSLHSGSREILCPECSETFDVPMQSREMKKKKVELRSLLCPDCWSVYQLRGEVPDEVSCPECSHEYDPHEGNTADGEFSCENGHDSTITGSLDANDLDEPHSFEPFGIAVYCPTCAGKEPIDHGNGTQQTLTGNTVRTSGGNSGSSCRACSSVNHKTYKAIDERDEALIEEAERVWAEKKSELPHPDTPIHDYQKTNRLVIHNYSTWDQLFNSRQLLSLGTILSEINEEEDQDLRESLVAAFLSCLGHQNMLNTYYVPYAQSAGAFGRHDYHPKVTTAEGIPFGAEKGRGTFRQAVDTVIKGKEYLFEPYDRVVKEDGSKREYPGDGYDGNEVESIEELEDGDGNLLLEVGDATELDSLPDDSIDHVVTDPPYAGAVQYSELADYFYGWLREALRDEYPEYLEEPETPKIEELVVNESRGKSQRSFYDGLQQVFSECNRVLKEDGLLCFTFHHSRKNKWSELLDSVQGAGFRVEAVYPVKSEATGSGNLVFHSNPNSAAYDVILVCSQAGDEDVVEREETISWEEFEDRTVERAREHGSELTLESAGGHSPSSKDFQMILWGECIVSYAQSEETVCDEDGEPLELEDALGRLRDLEEFSESGQ
jgi:hypothetical protein